MFNETELLILENSLDLNIAKINGQLKRASDYGKIIVLRETLEKLLSLKEKLNNMDVK